MDSTADSPNRLLFKAGQLPGPDIAPAGAVSPRRTNWLILLLTLLVQFVLQSHFFPYSSLHNSTRILRIDSPYHQYQMEVARQLCAEGQMTGYEPRFEGGNTSGVAKNASAKLQGLLACLAGTADAVAPVYKQVSFWQGVAAPAAIVVACLLLGLPPAVTALAALLAVLSWWTGAMRWYHSAGMVSYVIAAYAGIAFTVAAVQACLKPTVLRVFAVSAVAAIGMWVHPLFPLGAALAGALWLVSELRSAGAVWRAVAVVTFMAAAMVAVNAGWITASMQSLTSSPHQQPYQRAIAPLLPVLEVLGMASTAAGGSRLNAALLVGAVLCAVYWRGPGRRALLGLVGGGTVLMAWAALGAAVPAIAPLQPNRFSAMAWLCLIVPAAAGVCAAAVRLRVSNGRARALVVLPVAAFAVIVGYFVIETGREIFAPPSAGRYAAPPPEVNGEGPVSRQILSFLRAETDSSARVMFETSIGRVHDNAHMAGLLALQADREFIGGPYTFGDFASSWDGVAFGKPLSERTPDELMELLDAYNIRWMLCHSAACRSAMEALTGVTLAASMGPVTAYRRASSPGFVASGSGHVVARCVNRVEIDGAAGSPLILRYHWVPGLAVLPSGRIEPIELVPGARPFIAIHDPPRHLILRVGEGPGLPCDQRDPVQMPIIIK